MPQRAFRQKIAENLFNVVAAFAYHQRRVSLIFGSIVEVRRRLYEAGVLKTHRLHHPVVSVGNLTVGGTGKTPLVIALAGRLRDDGFRPVVLSRGYGRASSGVVIVSRGDGPIVPWRDAGDEPFLIAKRVRGAAVVVGADRRRAGMLAERENLGDMFILDDGFQHRRLHRDMDIVTIDDAEWAAGEKLLPWGPWREPKSALLRAHAACVRLERRDGMPELPIPAFRVETVVEGLYAGEENIAPESLREPVVAFAGIARPDRFFATLEGLGVRMSKRIPFRDHHTYTPPDIARLGVGALVTTEKDAVRIEEGGAGKILCLRVAARIERVDDLMAMIYERIGRAPTR
jgi:tetraacyldisaccharide 4'-kinase